ncbi:hypothetical protein RQP46_010695 [Phenoliferia psychrophenolica]
MLASRILGIVASSASIAAVTFNVHNGTARSGGVLDSAPVGVSIEFFAFPAYYTNLSTITKTCLSNFKELTGVGTPVRIGGTTQDRATFAPSQTTDVAYSVAIYTATDPIAVAAGGSWSPDLDADSQLQWQEEIGQLDLIQAGVYLQPPTWSTANLAPKEKAAGNVKYLKSLMSHSEIVSFTQQFKVEREAASAIGKPYHLAETNSATCGGGGISTTFGAALWIVDYVMQALIIGVDRLYFHHGTIGNCQYCWWGDFNIASPYYGAYFVTEALAKSSSIVQLDTGTDSLAAYSILDAAGKVSKVLLYNSEYSDVGLRSSELFTLVGLKGGPVSAKRLTSGAATDRVDEGNSPSISGLQFANATCAASGQQTVERYSVDAAGALTVTVQASEALLIFM